MLTSRVDLLVESVLLSDGERQMNNFSSAVKSVLVVCSITRELKKCIGLVKILQNY